MTTSKEGGFVLSSENIEAVLSNLRAKLPMVEDAFLVLPRAERVLSREKYRGKGRPRKSDYDYEEIDYSFLSSGFKP